MANLYQRNGSNIYWIRFQWRGSEIRKSARTTSKQEALRFLARTIEECRKLDRDGRTRHTFEEATYRFAQEHLPTLKPNSSERYRVSLRALAPTLKGLKVVVLVFSKEGYSASAQAPAAVASLGGGAETPFVVTLEDADWVDRFRVSFRTEDRVVPHVDRRGRNTIARTE